MASRAATAPSYRLRPGPRRRSGGRPASRVHWDKLGRVILVLVIFGVLASYVGPLMGLLSAYQDRNATAAQLTQLRRENTALRARASASRGPDPAEAAARRLGMVSPGEHSYFVKGLAKH
jgi:cell division protein FtsB